MTLLSSLEIITNNIDAVVTLLGNADYLSVFKEQIFYGNTSL